MHGHGLHGHVHGHGLHGHVLLQETRGRGLAHRPPGGAAVTAPRKLQKTVCAEARHPQGLVLRKAVLRRKLVRCLEVGVRVKVAAEQVLHVGLGRERRAAHAREERELPLGASRHGVARVRA